MDDKILSALIAAFASLGVTFVGLINSFKARRVAQLTEERYRQAEQVRVKALSAAESLFQAIGTVQRILEGQLLDRKMRQLPDDGMAQAEAIELGSRLAAAAAEIRETLSRTLVYWTPAVVRIIREIVAAIETLDLSTDGLKKTLAIVERQMELLAAEMRVTYLREATLQHR